MASAADNRPRPWTGYAALPACRSSFADCVVEAGGGWRDSGVATIEGPLGSLGARRALLGLLVQGGVVGGRAVRNSGVPPDHGRHGPAPHCWRSSSAKARYNPNPRACIGTTSPRQPDLGLARSIAYRAFVAVYLAADYGRRPFSQRGDCAGRLSRCQSTGDSLALSQAQRPRRPSPNRWEMRRTRPGCSARSCGAGQNIQRTDWLGPVGSELSPKQGETEQQMREPTWRYAIFDASWL